MQSNPRIVDLTSVVKCYLVKKAKKSKLNTYTVGSVKYEHLIGLKKDLKANLSKPRTNFNRAGLIKLFELAYEQAWKILKKVLMENYSIDTIGSKDTFREASKAGLIDDCERWLGFVVDRNLTVHTYQSSVADEIIDNLDEFVEELEILIQNLNKMRNE